MEGLQETKLDDSPLLQTFPKCFIVPILFEIRDFKFWEFIEKMSEIMLVLIKVI